MLVLDAPNKQNYKGRLAILDYAEMPADVICRRLKQWHRTACWQFTTGKRAFTGAPSAPDVVIAAYGTEYGGVLTVVDKTVFARQVNRVVSVILSAQPCRQTLWPILSAGREIPVCSVNAAIG